AVRPIEPRAGGDHLDAVAAQLVPDDLGLVLDHLAAARLQVRHRDPALDAVALAVKGALAVAREIEHGLTQRLARDRSLRDAVAAQRRPPLDDRDAPAQLRRLDRRALPAWPAADDDHVVV